MTAEEQGELGSRYFAAHPAVPAGQIIGDINLDMFLPLYALQHIEVQGLGESTLGDAVRAAAALFDRVILKLVERVADDPARPHWYQLAP